MSKSTRRRKGAVRPAAWRRRQALAVFIAEEFGLTRLEAAERIREAEASDEPAPLGYTACDRCPVVIVDGFDPEDPSETASARQAIRLHVLFCPGRAA